MFITNYLVTGGGTSNSKMVIFSAVVKYITYDANYNFQIGIN